MPMVISAPSTKLPSSPTRQPRAGQRRRRSPPGGHQLQQARQHDQRRPAAAPTPSRSGCARRGQPATTPAPSQAPSTEAAISSTRVMVSTSMIVM